MTHPLTPREKVELKPSFGDVIENGWASDANPTRIGFFVREFTRTGRLNPGVTWEITDGKGKFWEFKPKDISDGGRLKVTSRTALASGSGDHAELARGKACGDRMIATADALMPWLKNYPPSTRRERAIEAANAAAAASCGPLLAEIAALRAERDAKDLEIGRVIFRATEAERKLAEAVGLNDRAAELMRQCTDPERFEGASTLNVYANMRAWLSDLSKEAERG